MSEWELMINLLIFIWKCYVNRMYFIYLYVRHRLNAYFDFFSYMMWLMTCKYKILTLDHVFHFLLEHTILWSDLLSSFHSVECIESYLFIENKTYSHKWQSPHILQIPWKVHKLNEWMMRYNHSTVSFSFFILLR